MLQPVRHHLKLQLADRPAGAATAIGPEHLNRAFFAQLRQPGAQLAAADRPTSTARNISGAKRNRPVNCALRLRSACRPAAARRGWDADDVAVKPCDNSRRWLMKLTTVLGRSSFAHHLQLHNA
jgi:hypothetical protein